MLIRLTAKRHVQVDGQQYLRLLHWQPVLVEWLRAVGSSGGSLARRYGLHLSVVCAALLAIAMPSLPSSILSFSLSSTDAPAAAEARPYAEDVASFRGASSVPVIADDSLLEKQGLLRTVGAYYPEVMVTQYQVQSGDTLYTIADRFGLSVLTIFWANQSIVKEPDALALGQQLAILPTDGAYHTVADGETIESIAADYHVMPAIIVGYSGNKIPDPAHLAVGSLLVIPGAVLPELPPKVVPTASSDDNTGETYTAAPSNNAPGTGQLIWPVSGMISQRAHSGHMAIDIAGAVGTPVVAADSGTVTLVSWMTTSYGYHIIIDHGNGLETLYAHLSEIDVEVGQVVNQGDVIGKRGNTGRSTGPHTHFEVRVDGVQRDPMDYLP
jgi:murein DD-endopeptidase MepM/ murein hydrolase activator NlpD